MRADGTDVVRLTNDLAVDQDPAFAPDGRQLVFVSNRGGALKLYRMNADGSGVQALTDGPGQDLQPAWAGADIVFASNRGGNYELYRLRPGEAAPPENLTRNGAQNGSPQFSPDGRYLLFDSNRDGNYEVYRLNLTTLGVTQLTRTEPPAKNGEPAWRP